MLQRVPSTATITARSGCRLLVIERELFLAAVTSSAVDSWMALAAWAAWLGSDRQAG